MSKQKRVFRLTRSAVGILLAAICVWWVARKVSAEDLRRAIATADIGLTSAAAAVIVLTSIVKAWRWQYLYSAESRPPLSAAYRAIMVGQVVNLLSPVPRLGDIVRVFDLHQTAQTRRAESLGTLVSEKSFDMLFALLTILALLPLIVLPPFMSDSVAGFAAVVGLMFVLLTVLVMKGDWVLAIFGRITAMLPQRAETIANNLAASSLQGIRALRNPRILLLQLGLNILLIALAIATPFLMFQAFDLNLNIADAFLLNVAVMLGLTLPSAPARIGTFEGVVYAMLAYFGVSNEEVQLAYAIVFHAVVVVPPILIGALFLATSRYNWRRSITVQNQLEVAES